MKKIAYVVNRLPSKYTELASAGRVHDKDKIYETIHLSKYKRVLQDQYSACSF
jgi:hypothetical protein